MNIRLRSSNLLAISLVAGHVILSAVLWPLHVPLWGKLVANFILAASCVFYLRRDALLVAANSIVAVEIGEDRACRFQSKSQEWTECFVLDSSLVAPNLTILNLKLRSKAFARHVVILPDSLAQDDFRKLRVWLRWKCARKQDSGFGSQD